VSIDSNSFLFQTLHSFSQKERKELEKWLKSPLFNQRKDVLSLFYLLAEGVRKGRQNIEKEDLFSRLYPGKEYEDKQMRYVLSFLYQAIKEYLAFTEWRNEPFSESTYLLKSLRKRGLEKPFEREYKRHQKKVKAQPLRNSSFHEASWQLMLEQYQLSTGKSRKGTEGLEAVAHHFSISFATEYLRLAGILESQGRMSGSSPIRLPLLAEVVDWVKSIDLQQAPVTRLYYFSYLIQTEDAEEKDFKAFKKLLQEQVGRISHDEARALYMSAINYCIRMLNRGHSTYIQEALDLYLTGIETGILLDHGQLSRFTYNNVLMLALGQKQYEQALSFLKTYRRFLHPDYRENTFQYNLAIYHFRRGEYDPAMDLLRSVEFQDRLYNLNARSMLLRIYYETEAFDALDSLLHSFSIYLRRQKNLGYHRELYANLIAIVRKMLQKNLGDPTVCKELLKEVENTEVLAEREWVIKILND
jgi:hypothetical protein